jgi:acyl carrier protein
MTRRPDKPGKPPNQCPACGALDPGGRARALSKYGETPCQHCGKWLWFAKQRNGTWFHELERVALVRRRVHEIVAEHLGVNQEFITDSTSFTVDIGADTLDIVELVMNIEEEFKITIPDAEAEHLLTVGDLVDYLMRQLP